MSVMIPTYFETGNLWIDSCFKLPVLIEGIS